MVGRWRPFLLALVDVLFVAVVHAQDAAELINGQLFTRGLSIIDAPAPNSQHHAPGNLPIAVDVSGDGQLQNFVGSQLASLEIYLVSAEVGVNVTVAQGPALLAGEPGSTVKHLDFAVPACLPAGNYNLTFYEVSTFEDQMVYAITPVAIRLESKAPAGAQASFSCISPPPTEPQAQPQAQAPLPFAPFAPGGVTPSSTPPSPTPNAITTPSPPGPVTAPPLTPDSTLTSPIPPSSQPTNTASASTNGFFVPVAAGTTTEFSALLNFLAVAVFMLGVAL